MKNFIAFSKSFIPVFAKLDIFYIMIEFLTADTSSTASLLVTFLPMVLILVFMYIILYLPQKKQDKKDAAMRASIEVGRIIGISIVVLLDTFTFTLPAMPF